LGPYQKLINVLITYDKSSWVQLPGRYRFIIQPKILFVQRLHTLMGYHNSMRCPSAADYKCSLIRLFTIKLHCKRSFQIVNHLQTIGLKLCRSIVCEGPPAAGSDEYV